MEGEQTIHDEFLMVQDRTNNKEEQEVEKCDAFGNGNANDEGSSKKFANGNVQIMKPKGLMILWNNYCDDNVKILPNGLNIPSIPLPGLIRM